MAAELAESHIPEIRIECYTFSIKRRNARKNDLDCYLKFDEAYKKVNKTTGETITEPFHVLFGQFVQSFNGKYSVEKGKSLGFLSKSLAFNSHARTISGLVSAGTTSMGGELKNQDNSDAEGVPFSAFDVASHPYYFIIHIPESSNTGILIFQSYSTFSYCDLFKKKLALFLGNENGPILKFQTYIPPEVVDSFQNHGELKKISIYRNSISPDKAASIFKDEFRPTGEFNMELRITKASAFTVISNKIKGMIQMPKDQRGDFFSIEELDDIGFDDKSIIKFEFTHEGKSSTVTSEKNFEFSPNFYASYGDIERDGNYIPIFESVDMYCKRLLGSLKSRLYT